MDDETRREFERVHERIRKFAERYEWEWRDSGGWRTHWGAELDALEAEVQIIRSTLLLLEVRVSEVERSTTATADMVKAGLEEFARAVAKNVRRIVNADRKEMLKELDALGVQVSAVALELAEIRREAAQYRQETKAGIAGLSLQLSEYAALTEKHERELGGGHGSSI